MRRLIASFRRQDWSAVVVELFVVVLGVFIGVQASNWNQERETTRRAEDFTERLKADLREEAWGYDLQVSYYGQVLDNARRAVGALGGEQPLSDEALLISAYRATQYNGNIRRRATYDELTSTGEIGLIRDRALRDLAIRTYSASVFDDVVSGAQRSEYRIAFRKAIPHDVQHALGEACGDRLVPVGNYEAIAGSLDYPCTTGLSPEAIARAAAILRSGSEFAPLLRLRIADVETDIGNLTNYYKNDLWEPLRALAREQR